MKAPILLLIALLLSEAGLACSPVLPNVDMLNGERSTMVASPNGRFFLKLMPSRWKKDPLNKSQRIMTRCSLAIAFEVLADGQFKQLWSFRDRVGKKHFEVPLYSRFYLSSNGMSLVEVIQWSSSAKSDVVVTYSEGKEVKRYTPADFGVTKLIPGCPSGNWQLDIKRPVSYGPDIIKIKTVNNADWEIEVRTLELKEVVPIT